MDSRGRLWFVGLAAIATGCASSVTVMGEGGRGAGAGGGTGGSGGGCVDDCDDGNACTEDSCGPGGSCLNTNISASCDDGIACTVDSCDPVIGCVNEGQGPGGSLQLDFTGNVQLFTVPVCITTITIEVWGAQGQGSNGGLGGYAKGELTVSAGETLYITVGGQNGFNGGAPGWAAVARNGGGASDARMGGQDVANRIIVAGGGGGGGPTDVGNHAGGGGGSGSCGPNYCGGGGGQGYGGPGTNGGLDGGSGNASTHSGGAGGAGLNSGGQGSCTTSYNQSCGGTGTLGAGGAGDTWENGICYTTYGGTSGGGGGYYGGGGSSVGNCGSGGGGGGSSWTGNLQNSIMTGGQNSGDGYVVISW